MVLKIAANIAMGVFLLGFANVQAAPQAPGTQSWYQNRQSFYQGPEWHMRIFDRVRQDLNHVQDVTFHHKDQYRITQTEDQLTDLQSKLASGGYNQPELDNVIASLTTVVADNRLTPEDRHMLTDDLARLRDYRMNHANWH